ncbi:hypothetical protein VIGAN_06102900 [Vigna angularis var. angularis]|uniref:Uncharacterized protein n=1 Tax=Vigna angularis var. angularis TaxID=157739 RepID=A0A0S3SAT5_PHAAN|nr:hypothetical protein VIGAN_06102900 [Vigna angularis var. angularis]
MHHAPPPKRLLPSVAPPSPSHLTFVLALPPNAIPCYVTTTNLHHFHPRTSQIIVAPAALSSNLYHRIVHHTSLLQIANRHSSSPLTAPLLASTCDHNQTCKQTRSQVQVSSYSTVES